MLDISDELAAVFGAEGPLRHSEHNGTPLDLLKGMYRYQFGLRVGDVQAAILIHCNYHMVVLRRIQLSHGIVEHVRSLDKNYVARLDKFPQFLLDRLQLGFGELGVIPARHLDHSLRQHTLFNILK